MNEFLRSPVRYLQRNTDPRTVVSVVVAYAVLGGLVVAMRASGIKVLRQTAAVIK